MSLINQALRKAQNDRTPQRANNAVDHANAPSSAYVANNSSKTGLIIGLIAGIAILIGLVTGLTVVVLNKDPAPAASQITAAPAPQSTTQTAPIAPVATNSQQPVSNPSTASQPSVLDELRLAREAAEAKALAEIRAATEAKVAAEAEAARKAEAIERSVAEAKARAEAKPSQDIVTWLSEAKVSGVRISSTTSKAIINNKAYSIGDIVNMQLNLKIVIIQEARLLFADENGKTYAKQL